MNQHSTAQPRSYYERNREAVLARVKSRAERQKNEIAAYQAEYYKSNKEQRLQYRKHRYECNKQSESIYMKEWRQKNRKRVLEYYQTKKEYLRRATPPWVDLSVVSQIYMACPKGHHVDHVIPLRGKNVCGLHVHTNLQYLTATENLRKNNKFNPPAYDGLVGG